MDFNDQEYIQNQQSWKKYEGFLSWLNDYPKKGKTEIEELEGWLEKVSNRPAREMKK